MDSDVAPNSGDFVCGLRCAVDPPNFARGGIVLGAGIDADDYYFTEGFPLASKRDYLASAQP